MAEFNEDLTLEAPDAVDLDELLGLGEAAEEEKDTTTDVDKYGEVDEKIEYPHWKVNLRKFDSALKISNIVSQGSGRDVVSKAVGMEVKGSDLQIYLTDFDIYVEKSIEILNNENVLTDFIVVNLAIISKLIKACGSLVTVYKKEDKYFIKLIGGDMELETIKVDRAQMLLKDRSKFVKDGDIPTGEFYKVIKNLFVLANAAVSPVQRRIFFKGDEIVSVFLFCVGKYKAANPVPEMDIKIKDIKILYALAMGTDSEEIYVSKNGNRVLIEGGNFLYSFLLSDSKPPQNMVESVDKMFEVEPIYIDFQQLVKITDVSSDLMYSTSRLDFNYTEDGMIECILRTKRSDSTFILRGTPNPNLKPLKKHVSIQSNLLKVLLKVFRDGTVGMVLNEQGIGLKSDNYSGVLYTEGE